MNKEMIKQKKLLLFLLGILVLGFVGGLLFVSIISSDNKELVKESVEGYFEIVKSGKEINVFSVLKECLESFGGNLVIWLIGISIVGAFLAGIAVFFRSFLVGFSFASIVYTFKIKGVLLAIIYIIPEILSLFILFFLVYYAISFSILLFNYLFKKKEIVRTLIMRRYLKVLFLVLGACILNSLLKTLVIPLILQLF